MRFDVISEKEYRRFLKEIEDLMDQDPAVDSPDAERLKLISIAVQEYEKNKFHFEKPSPIEAIKFRMTEMGLNQNDLIPYLGGKNRVSEVLSKKRSLTLPMIKALHKYLEIPLEILMQEEDQVEVTFNPESFEFADTLVKEIQKKGWIPKNSETGIEGRRLIANFLKPIGGLNASNVLFRKSPQANVRGISQTAAFLWSSKVLIEGSQLHAETFHREKISFEFLKEVARLSFFEKGPLLAREKLLSYGIKLVIVPHLSSTYLDGGVVSDVNGNPIIGLSLRYDRLDNFWHTLMHELVHVWKHFQVLNRLFLDDSDIGEPKDPIEKEADQFARDAFVPKPVWRSSDVLHFRTQESILELARELHIHPAIIAGRVRFETQNFRLFSDLLGANTVRKMFGLVS